MKVEEIIPEIKALTTYIYYEKLQELIDFIVKNKDINKYQIVCQEQLYNECKRIGSFFGIEIIKSFNLPENILMLCVKKILFI
mgnify:CR=1 FL=1